MGSQAEDWDAWMISLASYRLKRDPGNGRAVLGIDLGVDRLRVRPERELRLALLRSLLEL